MTKTVLIGLDGGTLDLMLPWIEQGKLPSFSKIKQNGIYGKLRSTTPYYSAPAWVSMVTGVQPGKHGIYDFFRTDTCVKRIVNSRNRKVPAIWKFLTDEGKRSIIVNVPGTYPPDKINGVMITGLLTPSPSSNFTYPKELKKALTPDKLGSYVLEQVAVDDIPKNLTARYAPEKLADQINEMTSSHGRVTMNLMKMDDWDFTMVVFRGTDDVQHLLWDRMDLILSCYQKADEHIGHMMKEYPDANFVIVSDHGFGKPKKYFYVNNALFNEGYLHTTSNPTHNLNTIIALLFDRFSRIIFHLIPLQKLARSEIGRKLIMSGASQSTIDYEKTVAMYHSVCSRGIRINLKGKYPYGIVDPKDYESVRAELISFLKQVKDPETGKRIVKKIYTGEEIYGENAVNDPLDIIFDLEEEYGAQELLQPPEGLKELFTSSKHNLSTISTPGFYDWMGDHRPHGIFFISGNNIVKNKQVNASIVDIVPTILAMLDVSLSPNFDGRVLTEVFKTPPKIRKTAPKKQTLSINELQAIDRLRKKL
jgi:predicted AlkP superfamily phosphohydrolase/phosphomutase